MGEGMVFTVEFELCAQGGGRGGVKELPKDNNRI